MIKSASQPEGALEAKELSGPSKFVDTGAKSAILNALNLKAPKATRLAHIPSLAEKALKENTSRMDGAKVLPNSARSAFRPLNHDSMAYVKALTKEMEETENAEAAIKSKSGNNAKANYKPAVARAKEVGVQLPKNYRKRYKPDEIIQLVNVVDTYNKQQGAKRRRPGF